MVQGIIFSFFAGLPCVSVVSFVLPTERSIHYEMECNIERCQNRKISAVQHFRLSIENLFKKQYPEERFLKELDLEIHYFFWAKIEWEIFITAWPPYISKNEINRIISEYHINRPLEQELPERIDVQVLKYQKIMPKGWFSRAVLFLPILKSI